MAIYKCKMCGGELSVSEGNTVIECDFCGTTQTVPSAKDENLQGLFNRANILRMKSEFDKAEQIYERIVQADNTQAEAYWGLILCKFGIEYVEDPATFKRVPTCHRTSLDSIIADDDYKSALTYADSVQRGIYESEAKEIDRLQKEIIALSQKEDPYDVFICYKETDETGRRTQDSVIANDIYYQLTQEGFKVFYAAITLEDKLGAAYEPCIFAALNSAKVMLSIGTKPEYFNAVWVKNEWSRYLKMMKKDRSKMLIPCYKEMDAYELPEEFAHLQAQDMSKIGFINDLVRGIKKVLVKNEPKKEEKVTVISDGSANVAPLLKRAFMFLEDGNWQEANAYCEKVLDQDPENAKAYVGKLMAELRANKIEQLPDQANPFDERNNYQKAIRFADDGLRNTLTDYVARIKERNENTRLDSIYESAAKKMASANSEQEYLAAAESFEAIANWKDSASKAKDCQEKAEACRKNDIYNKAISLMNSEDEFKIKQAIPLFESIEGWLDADDLVRDCPEYAETARKNNIYNKAISIGQKDTVESITEAIGILQGLSGWKDSPQKVMDFEDRIQTLKQLEEERKAQEAARKKAEAERKAEEERIAAEKRAEQERIALAKAKKRKKIKIIVLSLAAILSVIAILISTVIIPTIDYNNAVSLLKQGEYRDAYILFDKHSNFKDSSTMMKTLEEDHPTLSLITSQPNDIFTFGSYEQDNNPKNGKEDIEWVVLYVDELDAKALLVSKNVLDSQPFDSNNAASTFTSSSLYAWLQDSFASTAFTDIEISYVSKAITIPSENDEKQYSIPKAEHTQYAMSVGSEYKNYWAGKSWWTYWLAENAAESNGERYAYVAEGWHWATDVTSKMGVRPMLWINIGE